MELADNRTRADGSYRRFLCGWVVRMSGSPGRAPTIAAVAAGGVIGSEARYLLGIAFAQAPGSWPWTTFWINVTGCLLIGVLYAALTELGRADPLLRPLLGVGVLGGYTTFSTFSVETVGLADAGRPALALLYALVAPVAAVLACALGVAAARRGAGPGRGATGAGS